MSFNLSAFKNNVIYPARPTMFNVQVNLAGTEIPNLQFVCESASVPSKEIGTFELSYFGRKIQHAGDLKFPQDWDVTIINEEGNPIRSAFEQWFELANATRSGVRDAAFGDALAYKGVATVIQQTQTGQELPSTTYRVEGMFPTFIDEMKLDWTENDTYMKFNVRFAMDWWSTLNTPEDTVAI